MLRKQTLLVMLVGLNLMLLAALIIGSYSLPEAYAQPGGRGGYVCATQIVSGQGWEVLYVLDLKYRKLHAFYPRPQGPDLAWGGFRDLEQDFRGQP